MPPAASFVARRSTWMKAKEGVFLIAYGITDRGLVRAQNQDSYTFWTEDQLLFAIVCDGMGGARSGNVASQMAVELFSEQVKTFPQLPPSDRMTQALTVANDAVLQRSLTDPDCAGMGTTLVTALVQPDKHVYLMNVGDSRCYHISEDGIVQVTRDHSLVANLVAQGKITPEQARTHPNRNIITRALGTEQHVVGDLYELDLHPGEFLLLCSDGLSNQVEEQEMLFEALYGGDESTCCQRLLDIALSRGAPDNVTAILIACGDETESN